MKERWEKIRQNKPLVGLLRAILRFALIMGLILGSGKLFIAKGWNQNDMLMKLVRPLAGAVILYGIWGIIHSIVPLDMQCRETRKKRQEEKRRRQVEQGELELVWAIVTGVRVNSHVRINGKNPVYLRYRLEGEEHEIRIHDTELQEAVGCRLPVYRTRGGKLEPDPAQIDWSSKPEPSETKEPGTDGLPIRKEEQERQSLERELRKNRKVLTWVIVFGLILLLLSGFLFYVGFIRPRQVVPQSLIMILPFAGTGGFVLFYVIRSWKAIRELESTGEPLQATIIRIERGYGEKTKRDRNGLIQYTVICEANGLRYNTETVSPPANAIGKTVTVFVVKNNPKIYRVIMESVN